MNRSIGTIGGTLTDTTTPLRSGPGSNGNKEALHTLCFSRTETSPLDADKCHTVVT